MAKIKNQNGFTLVEVIVVSVIVAILAAVAIPLYTGYVNSSRQERVTNLAQTAAASANAHVRKTNTNFSAGTIAATDARLKLFIPDAAEYTIAIVSPTLLTGTITVTDTKGNVGTATY